MNRILVALLSCLFFLCVSAQAAPNPKAIAKLSRKIVRQQSKLQRLFNKLSSENKLAAINEIGSSDEDSDSDGVPDLLEPKSGRCDSDSDDDGVDDHQEIENGTDPGSDDSDGDGHTDDVEFHAKGTIDSLSDSAISVASVSYTVNQDTKYLDKKGKPLSSSDFSAGDCVEVEGYVSNSDHIVDKVKEDNDCGGSDD